MSDVRTWHTEMDERRGEEGRGEEEIKQESRGKKERQGKEHYLAVMEKEKEKRKNLGSRVLRELQ